MEACPWGLAGYGFDPYIAATPGNMVQALASFWADNTRVSLAVEERFPGRCHRIRYEDLVTDPEDTASGLFAFLDVAPAPGITQACFSAERERFGPADFKIWSTSRIMPDSVGRGWSVPSGMIAPQLLAAINEMAATLGYLPVEGVGAVALLAFLSCDVVFGRHVISLSVLRCPAFTHAVPAL